MSYTSSTSAGSGTSAAFPSPDHLPGDWQNETSPDEFTSATASCQSPPLSHEAIQGPPTPSPVEPSPMLKRPLYNSMSNKVLPSSEMEDCKYTVWGIQPIVLHEIMKHFGLYYASEVVFDSTVCRLFMGLNIKAGLAVMDVVRASQQAVGELEMRQFLLQDLNETIEFIS